MKEEPNDGFDAGLGKNSQGENVTKVKAELEKNFKQEIKNEENCKVFGDDKSDQNDKSGQVSVGPKKEPKSEKATLKLIYDTEYRPPDGNPVNSFGENCEDKKPRSVA